MAKRLSVKHRKTRRDKARAHTEIIKAGGKPKRHKVAEERSRKHLKARANVMR
jgi:hypothetical protein